MDDVVVEPVFFPFVIVDYFSCEDNVGNVVESRVDIPLKNSA
jgi:hypothetical protein